MDNVSLSLQGGEISTILGRNGAGKTTLLKILGTQLKPTSGGACVLGFDVNKEAGQIRKRIALMPQDARTLGPLTPWDHVYNYLIMRGEQRVDARRRASEALEGLDLGVYQKQPCSRLSGGTRHRVIAAMVMACEAELVFLDEPSLGLDPVSKQKLWQSIRRIIRNGTSVVLTTNNLDEAEKISDKLVLLNNGSIIAQGTVDQFKAKSDYQVRIEISDPPDIPDLAQYGRVIRSGNPTVILTSVNRAKDLESIAVGPDSRLIVSKVTLEDIFVQSVEGQ